jgi:hypothetical protein
MEQVCYVSPYSILIHNKAGLKRVYCPFRVNLRQDHPELDQVPQIVQKVGLLNHCMVYLIHDNWYAYSLFEIL